MAMSPTTSRSSRKRKHGDEFDENAELSQRKKTKKEKRKKDITDGEEKEERKEKRKKKDEKHKKKSKKDKQFKTVNASIDISIPPRFFMDPMAGATEMLDSLVMRHVSALGGVMLSHSNIQFLSKTAAIKYECPFSNCTVGFDATVWSPQVGMKLTGTINLCSPDHISLLVHRTFNVSIPRHHIPTDHWEFEYGSADRGGSAQRGDASDEDVVEADETEASGAWVHKITGERIGGNEGELKFTVIGLNIANQMLSLVGSIQPDPFSSEHVLAIS